MPIFAQSETEINERRLAAVTHVASIFFPILGPAIAYSLFRRKSDFVSFHAMTALFDAIILKAFLLVGGLVSLGFTIARVTAHIREKGMEFSWDVVWPILLKMGVTWAILFVLGIVLTIQSIFQALAAYRGQWKGGAISGRLATKTLSFENRDRAS